jgi:nucleoid-associated protein YgaU
MGLLDFTRDAGRKIGIGKGSAQTQASEAAKRAAVVAAERAKEQAVAEAASRAAAAKARGAFDAAAKATAEKAAQEAAQKAAAAKYLAAEAAMEARAELAQSQELEDYVTKLGLNVTGLNIRFDDGTAWVVGNCPTEVDREKVILAVGNVGEVNRVVDVIGVQEEADPSRQYTVVKGDTLSKIAKEMYGNASKYPVIFEANKPMLKDADEIFVGQILRIPEL